MTQRTDTGRDQAERLNRIFRDAALRAIQAGADDVAVGSSLMAAAIGLSLQIDGTESTVAWLRALADEVEQDRGDVVSQVLQ